MVKEVSFNEDKMSVIGYSEADFATLIQEKKLYIDRTAFIRTMEKESNKNLLFVRPRRFGKSLWLSILHYYYGVQHKDQFDTLFGHLEIGQNPTPSRNSYLVLILQFSGIDVATDVSTFNGFRANVLTGILMCMGAYKAYFSEEDMTEIKNLDTPANMIQRFFQLYKKKQIPHPLYILIDEYDQFANELVSLDTERFRSIVGMSGFVRKFYEMIKFAANSGIVNRFFATGVSPLTVDALTSGFNITTNLSLEIDFHDLLGFREPEVVFILQQVGATAANIPALIADLKAWYNGYLFNEEAEERLYNSDMIMYFASHYEKRQRYPMTMLDANIATDYTKVKQVFNIQQREEEFIPILKQLTSEGLLSAEITYFFNLEKPFSEDDLISLLFYMGWITIQDKDEGIYRFKMPNRVISELYYDYFVTIAEREAGLNNAMLKIRNALLALSKNNNPHPFLELIKALIDKDLSLRDAQGFDEKHLKMLMIPYLSLSASHYVVSEPEWENGYIDVLLLKRPNVTTKYNFVLELKYVKKSDMDKTVLTQDGTKEKLTEKVEREARTQMTNYLKTDNAKRIPSLKAWLIVLVGREWQVVEEIPVG
jgi:Predicted AAA-ATPase/PD-(D/E)XK nuclease superfamily